MAFCIVASGALVYVYLAIAARSLPSAAYGWFGAYWSLALVIGFGAFLPIELELARLVHLRPPGARLPAGTGLATGGLVLLSAAVLLATWPWLSRGLGGGTALLWPLLGICAVSAGQFVLRGTLLGRGQVGRHGVVLLVDSALRVAGAAVVAAAVAQPTAALFAWTLVGAIAVAHVPLVLTVLVRQPKAPPARSVAEPGADADRLRAREIGHLMLATLSAQALLNVAPILVTSAAGPGEHARAAAFVASFTLVRLPLFVAVPLQSTLLPALTEVSTTASAAAQRRLVLRLAGAIVGLAVLAGALAAAVGPFVVGLVFGSRYALSGWELAVLMVGSILYLGLLVATQGLVATGRHRDSAIAWISGLVVAGAVFAAVPALVPRVAFAFPAGCAVALAVGTAALLRRRGGTPAVTAAVGSQEGGA